VYKSPHRDSLPPAIHFAFEKFPNLLLAFDLYYIRVLIAHQYRDVEDEIRDLGLRVG
jgi:hypothetical protein